MKVWFFVVCFLVPCQSRALSRVKRIINGREAEPMSFPFMVSLQVYEEEQWYHLCGAVLVHTCVAVTAAHCMDVYPNYSMRVVAGSTSLVDDGNINLQVVHVSRYLKHENYADKMNYPNDIALVYLSSPVTLTQYVQLAQLPPPTELFNGSQCVISGWGVTHRVAVTAPDNLMTANITALSHTDCNKVFKQHGRFIFATHKHICVQDLKDSKTSACIGDSGGSLMCGEGQGYLTGIISWAYGTCYGGLPSVCTRITSYLDWINRRLECPEIDGNETNGNETNGNETNGNETNGNETNGNETNGNETNGNETNGNETNGNETNGNETNGTETNGNQFNGNETNGNDTNRTETNGNEIRGNETNGNDTNGNETNGNEINETENNRTEIIGTETNGSDVTSPSVSNDP
ncbi:fibrinolytic enzyme, isozyme C-like [Physella acuta]|uniref:fibrinolytic enzyme, isozyme C-like n=1 Tax=Physella acuta TaxID=109671 RepID=UPI0027DE96FD|nr:fibrinolytic enzyme, isozyme C-like [Physella acuta]